MGPTGQGPHEARYEPLLTALSPQGAAWPTEAGSAWRRLLAGLAAELGRIHKRAEDLLDEADPRTTLELLEAWERVAGLPDPCTPAGVTLQERRAALVARITGRGGQSRAFFSGLAASLGYAGVTITEFRPFIAGVGRCGARLGGPHSVRHSWRVAVPDPRLTLFRTGESRSGDRLGRIERATDLECLFARLKPAHTTLIFAYEGA